MKFKTIAILLSFGAVYSGAAYGMEPESALESAQLRTQVLQSLVGQQERLMQRAQKEQQDLETVIAQYMAAMEQSEREATAREIFYRDQSAIIERMPPEARGAAFVTLNYKYKAALAESTARMVEVLHAQKVTTQAICDENTAPVEQLRKETEAQPKPANSFVEKM